MYHYTPFLVVITLSVHLSLTHAFSMQRSTISVLSRHGRERTQDTCIPWRSTLLFYKSKPYEEDSAEIPTTTAASKDDSENTASHVDNNDNAVAVSASTTPNGTGTGIPSTPTKPKSKVSRVKSTTAGEHVLKLETLEQLKNALNFNKDRVVVVRFFSHQCKSCAAVTPKLNRLARLNPKARFIDIPITKDNPDVQKEMNIYAVPFGHIYYPTTGLVEEVKMSKTHWSDFEDIFYSYMNHACDVTGLDNNYSNPLSTDVREYILLKKQEEISNLKKKGVNRAML